MMRGTSSYAGYVSMTIALMTVISALASPRLISCFVSNKLGVPAWLPTDLRIVKAKMQR